MVCQYQILAKYFCINLGMIILNQNMETQQNYVILIVTVLLFSLKLKFYKDIDNDVERWFDASNFDENDERPLLIGKNKKVLDLFKLELGWKIMIEFVANRAKVYSYPMEDGSEHKLIKLH